MVGGSGGLGAAIAEMLAARGSDVAVTYRGNKDAGNGSPRRPPSTAYVIRARLDVTSADACAQYWPRSQRFMADSTPSSTRPGRTCRWCTSRGSPADFAEQLTQDAVGFFNLCTPLPLLRESGGSIVAVTTAATARFPVRDGLSVGAEGRRRGSSYAGSPPRKAASACAPTPSGPGCSPTAWPHG